MYFLVKISRMQLHNVMVTRNKLMQDLLEMESNSSASIKNSIVTENNVSRILYFLLSMSRIQLPNITFIRNKVMQVLLQMQSNSSAMVNNNTIAGNNIDGRALNIHSSIVVMSTISLENNAVGGLF